MILMLYFFCFFFNDTATTEIYTLSLHDALPICKGRNTKMLRIADLFSLSSYSSAIGRINQVPKGKEHFLGLLLIKEGNRCTFVDYNKNTFFFHLEDQDKFGIKLLRHVPL